jgi:hypothetical protein
MGARIVIENLAVPILWRGTSKQTAETMCQLLHQVQLML